MGAAHGKSLSSSNRRRVKQRQKQLMEQQQQQHWQQQSSRFSTTATPMTMMMMTEETCDLCDLCDLCENQQRSSLAWKRSQGALAGVDHGHGARSNGNGLRNSSESSLDYPCNGARSKHQLPRVPHLGPSAYLVDRDSRLQLQQQPMAAPMQQQPQQQYLFPPLASMHSGSSGSRVVSGSRHQAHAQHRRRRRATKQQHFRSSHTLAETTTITHLDDDYTPAAAADFLYYSPSPAHHRKGGRSVMQSSSTTTSSSGAGTGTTAASTGTAGLQGTRAALAPAAAAAARTSEAPTTTTTIANSIMQSQTSAISQTSTPITNNTTTMTPSLAVKCTGQMARNQCGLALSHKQREKHGLIGLLPAAVQEQDLQVKAVLNYLDKCQDELSKYVYLRNLKDFNERLYYYTLTRNVEKLMPLVYTPTVGLACQRFSEIYQRPRGVFITINDLGRVSKLLANWPEKDVRVIVVTDGERILGLGDLGANGMGISIGKLSLYTALAGIPPDNVLPITIDVGTNNEEYLKDPFYIGLRQRRVRGEQYDALLEEFMQAVVDRWGPSCLIQFEDFANSTAFVLLERYRNRYCTFNDDIQGTASVCLSGLITAAKEIKSRLADCSFLFYGAGEANLGTAHLLMMAMVEDGIGKDEAKKRVWLVDSKGLVVTSRSDLTGHKREFAQPVEHIRDLESIIDFVKPTAIVGASAQGGSFNESICKKMAQFNERPIIFALSNPTHKAECTASQAYEWTSGKCVFASGSPFDPVVYNGKTYITGQGNNAYIFPGVGLAAIGSHTHIIPEETFLIAARALSDQVTASDTSVGLVYPRLNKIREVTLGVAARVLEYFYAERLANFRPEPSDKREFLRQIQYQPRYELDEI